MAITKTQAVLTGALLLGGGTAVVLQQREQTALRGEIATLDAQNASIVRLQEENRQLAHTVGEMEILRTGTAELPRLREEIAALRKKEQSIAAPRSTSNPRTGRPRLTAADQAALNPTDHMPVPRFTAQPVYPFELRQSGISGQTVVKVVVDSNGDVQNASIVKSTHRELEAATLEAVKQWKFDPGMKGGKNVNTTIQVPFVFNIEPEEPDWF
jgi:TonB family protein